MLVALSFITRKDKDRYRRRVFAWMKGLFMPQRVFRSDVTPLQRTLPGDSQIFKRASRAFLEAFTPHRAVRRYSDYAWLHTSGKPAKFR
jgi:hypothetical protein